jgi:hypothetical protein
MKNQKAALAVAICCLGSLAETNLSRAALTQLDITYNTTYTGFIHDSLGSENVYLTAFSATRVGGDPLPAGHTDPFTTFCLDVRYNLNEPAYWQSQSFPNPNNGPAPTWQIGGIYRAASLYGAYVGLASGANFSSAQGKIDGAALQLAIWEVLYETSGTYNVLSGNANGFWVTGANSAITTQANAMLAGSYNVVDSNITTTFWDAKLDRNGNTLTQNQDLIGPFTPVPEPGTYIAGALLLLPFLGSTIRRRVQS